MSACYDGYKNVVQYLIEHGAEVNPICNKGQSVIFNMCNKRKI